MTDSGRGTWRTWVEVDRLTDRALHVFVADVGAKGHDLRLIERRRGWWTRLYDIELRDARRETWRQVLGSLRKWAQ